jgi:hypothetical protein
MPEEAKPRGRHEKPGASASPFTLFFEVNQQATTQWLQTISELSQEIAQFAQTRFQEDAAAWVSLLACHKPEEVMECQRRFTAKAAEQYGEEIDKLSRIMTRVPAIGAFSPAHRRPYTDA